MGRRLDQFKPPSPLAGRLSIQAVIFAIGDGTFMTSSAVFFTQVVGLSAAQVGIGITVSGIVAFLSAVPAGKLADRIGPQRLWAIGALGTGAMYAVWPFINGFVAFLAMCVVLEAVNSAGGAARGAFILDVLPRAERIKSQAFLYAAMNLGFTLGAALGGIALAFESNTPITLLPWVTTVLCLFNAYYISRLPKAPHKERPTAVEVAADSGTPPVTPASAPTKAPEGTVEASVPAAPATTTRPAATTEAPGALRNVGFLATSFFTGVLYTNQVLLNLVIPLWLVEQTDAPRVLLAWLFGTNTVMCIFLPMAAARTVRDVSTALRAVRISSVFFVVSCVITLFTHDTVGWVTIALVWLGHVTVTGAELYLSAANWAFESELSDPDKRGEYQGASELGGTLGYVWAPAAFTFLAMEWGATGWVLIAGIIVLATVLMHPATRAAQRFVERYGLDPSR